MEQSKPNFLIAGVARCGTTSLYHYIKQHPSIGLPNIKEPKFFSSRFTSFPHNGIGDSTVDAKIIRTEHDYFSLFEGLNKYEKIGEASSDYFYYHQKTVPAIKATLGDIPVIIVIRNPIERSFSAYNNLLRDNREKLSFKEALDKEEERIENNWDWMWHYKKGSLYADGIQNFMSHFSNVKVILYDDLKNDPEKTTKGVFDFLNVSSDFKPDTSVTYSHSGKIGNSLIATLTRRDLWLTNMVRNIAFALIPRSFLEKKAGKIMKKETLSAGIQEKLKKYFIQDIENTEKILNKDLSDWKR